MPETRLTTTSFAILGLLAIQPWSTYELTKLMRRALLAVWPRAESNLYREPQRLVDAGLATARRVDVGRRRRTEYAITPAGRRALREWLASPASPTVLESEAALKVLFANHTTLDVLQQRLDEFAAEAEAADEPWRAIAREYVAGEGAFPERIHVNVLYWVLLDRWARLRADWARWASAVVATWPDSSGPEPARSRALLEAALSDDPGFLDHRPADGAKRDRGRHAR
jgi:DNA-binding PadR family transcriptional regulator